MKCVDCGTEVPAELKEVELRVTLPNPGVVSAKGKVLECPQCKQVYSDEEESLRLIEEFEKDCTKSGN